MLSLDEKIEIVKRMRLAEELGIGQAYSGNFEERIQSYINDCLVSINFDFKIINEELERCKLEKEYTERNKAFIVSSGYGYRKDKSSHRKAKSGHRKAKSGSSSFEAVVGGLLLAAALDD